MNIKILDCTLRDGGYINNWEFGESTIKSIVGKLVQSKINIIECGFLTAKTRNKNSALFNTQEELKEIISPKSKDSMYVAMIQFGEDEIKLEQIPNYKDEFIDGIRIIFQENDIEKAIEYGKSIKEKGYKVFMQPVKITFYDDTTLLQLIKKINSLNPYAFYIVDTFGSMSENDLLRLYYLIDNNLKDSIKIGFHSHNNLQLSFSNAQALMNLKTKREIIIDSSVFGMGRGAGNLATELLAQFINDNVRERYEIAPLLNIYDEHLAKIFSKTPWGYSLPHFLSAVHNCHPNYSTHLLNKQTIAVEAINVILNQIPYEKKSIYDKVLIEELYLSYQKHKIDDSEAKKTLSKEFKNRKILILAPGKTIKTEDEKIKAFIKEANPMVISVNFEHKDCDFIFVSNVKRFNILVDNLKSNKPIIATSNITAEKKDNLFILNYESLLLNKETINDNAGMMLLKYLESQNIKEIYLGGFDGFNEIISENYFDNNLINITEPKESIIKNKAVKNQLIKFSNVMNIKYITTSFYDGTQKLQEP